MSDKETGGWVYDPATRQAEHPDYGTIVYGVRNGYECPIHYVDLGGTWHGPFPRWGQAAWFAWITQGGTVPFPAMTDEDIAAARQRGHRWFMETDPKYSSKCGYCNSEIRGAWIYMPKCTGKNTVRCTRCYMIERIIGQTGWKNRQARLSAAVPASEADGKRMSWQPVSESVVQATLPDGRIATVFRPKGKQWWKASYPPDHEYGPWPTKDEATRAVELWAQGWPQSRPLKT